MKRLSVVVAFLEQHSSSAMGSLGTITGRMKCGVAGRKS